MLLWPGFDNNYVHNDIQERLIFRAFNTFCIAIDFLFQWYKETGRSSRITYATNQPRCSLFAACDIKICWLTRIVVQKYWKSISNFSTLSRSINIGLSLYWSLKQIFGWRISLCDNPHFFNLRYGQIYSCVLICKLWKSEKKWFRLVQPSTKKSSWALHLYNAPQVMSAMMSIARSKTLSVQMLTSCDSLKKLMKKKCLLLILHPIVQTVCIFSTLTLKTFCYVWQDDPVCFHCHGYSRCRSSNSFARAHFSCCEDWLWDWFRCSERWTCVR